MRHEEIGNRTLQNHDPDALIGLDFPAEPVELLREGFVKEIYRRMVDADECHPGVKLELEKLVIRIWHG